MVVIYDVRKMLNITCCCLSMHSEIKNIKDIDSKPCTHFDICVNKCKLSIIIAYCACHIFLFSKNPNMGFVVSV